MSDALQMYADWLDRLLDEESVKDNAKEDASSDASYVQFYE